MQLVVLCNNRSQEELLDQAPATGVVWIKERKEFFNHPGAAGYMDLQFDNRPDTVKLLQQLLPKPVIVDSVTETLASIHHDFIRINAWPSFLQGRWVEGSCHDSRLQEQAAALFALFGKQVAWLPDEPGFVSARVVSMIINEAFFAAQDGVSTPAEVDTAMKLGTNYPYGPFAWGELIGLKKVAGLLQTLSKEKKRYQPCPLLLKEASQPGTTLPNG